MASFQAKIGCKTYRKSENKNCHSVPFRSYTTHNKKFQKNCEKVQKIKKNTIMASFQVKIPLSVRTVPTRRVIENSNKIAKN